MNAPGKSENFKSNAEFYNVQCARALTLLSPRLLHLHRRNLLKHLAWIYTEVPGGSTAVYDYLRVGTWKNATDFIAHTKRYAIISASMEKEILTYHYAPWAVRSTPLSCTAQSETTTIADLPSEILTHVARFLTPKEKVTFARHVSMGLRAVLEGEVDITLDTQDFVDKFENFVDWRVLSNIMSSFRVLHVSEKNEIPEQYQHLVLQPCLISCDLRHMSKTTTKYLLKAPKLRSAIFGNGIAAQKTPTKYSVTLEVPPSLQELVSFGFDTIATPLRSMLKLTRLQLFETSTEVAVTIIRFSPQLKMLGLDSGVCINEVFTVLSKIKWNGRENVDELRLGILLHGFHALNNSVLTEMQAMSNLSTLGLHGFLVNHELMTALTGLRLKSLECDRITAQSPTVWKLLGNLTTLETLSLRFTAIYTSTISSVLKELCQLRHLDLYGNPLIEDDIDLQPNIASMALTISEHCKNIETVSLADAFATQILYEESSLLFLKTLWDCKLETFSANCVLIEGAFATLARVKYFPPPHVDDLRE